MFTTSTKNIITSLVDQFLNRREYKLNRKNFSIIKEAMIFHLLLSVYDRETQKQLKINVKLLFTGSTHVFYTIAKDYFEEIPYSNWINTSNHDSCWRSDGLHFLDNLYFDMCKQVNNDTAPINLESIIDFRSGNLFDLFEKTYVEIKRDEDINDYKYKIINMNKDIRKL